jgi:signal transduction histidine kinase/serine/threonine protein kinase
MGDFAENSVLGKYRLVRELGRGGMAVVYRAVDSSNNETVALKVLKAPPNAHSDYDAISRFRKEAHLLAGLRHQNIVRFIEFGSENDTYFLSMELIEGVNLRQIIQRRGSFELMDAIDIAVQLAEVIQYTEGQGLVHRDLKPQNVMVVPSLGTDIVKVLDFGLSTLTHAISGGHAEEERLVGTVSYAAPEQAGLIDRNVDSRADLYSLGIIIYEMLSGQHPFQKIEIEQLLDENLAMPCPLHELRSDIPKVIGEIVRLLMLRNPDSRYQSGMGLLKDLLECRRRFQDGRFQESFTLGTHDHFRDLSFGGRLVGRERHLDVLKEVLGFVETGTPHTVVIEGEIGVGKSFLISEFRPFSLASRSMFLNCRIQRMAGEFGLKPITGILEEYFRRVSRSSVLRKEEVLIKLAPLLIEQQQTFFELIPSAKGLAQDLLWLVQQGKVEYKKKPQNQLSTEDSSSEESQKTLLLQMIILIAQIETALILQFDDLEWGDAELHALIGRLFEEASLQKAKLMLIVTLNRGTQHGFDSCQAMFAAWKSKGYILRKLHVERLNRTEVIQFVADALKGYPEKFAPLAVALHEYTGGNPLFLREVLKSLVAGRILQFDSAQKQWTYLSTDFSSLKPPFSVVDVILERTRELSQEGQVLLSTAALLGLDFDESTLKHIHPEASEGVAQTLDFGVRNHFLSCEKNGFNFAHPRVREYFLNQMVDSKEAIHQKIVSYLDASPPREVNAFYIRTYAWHSWVGFRNTNPQRVFAACCTAAKLEVATGDWKGAAELLERALTLTEDEALFGSDDILPIQLELSEIYLAAGESQKSLKLLDKAYENLSSQPGDLSLRHILLATEKRARIMALHGQSLSFDKRFQGAVDIAASLLHSACSTEASFSGENLNFLKKFLRIGSPITKPEEIPDQVYDQAALQCSVQIIFIAYYYFRADEYRSFLAEFWKRNKGLFLSTDTSLLWNVWFEDFLEFSESTDVQRLIEEVFVEKLSTKQNDVIAAELYLLCIRMLFETPHHTPSQTHDLFTRLERLSSACLKQGFCHPVVQALLVKAGVRYLRGDWDDVVKSCEEAIVESERIGFPGLISDCYATFAFCLALRDRKRAKGFLDRMSTLPSKSVRATRLGEMAKSLMSFADAPFELSLAKAVETTLSNAGAWWDYSPLALTFHAFSVTARICSEMEGRLPFRKDLSDKFRKRMQLRAQISDRNCYFICVLSLLDKADSPETMGGIESHSSLAEAEKIAQELGFSTWFLAVRLYLYRAKLHQSLRTGSPLLRDEAMCHLGAAAIVANEIFMNDLGDSLDRAGFSDSPASAHSGSSVSMTIARDLSIVLKKLRIDKVFTLGNAIISKHSVDALLNTALEGLLDLSGAERGCVFLKMQASQDFEMRAARGIEWTGKRISITTADLGPLEGETNTLHWSSIRKVKKDGKHILLDFAAREIPENTPETTHQNVPLSVLCFPVTFDDRVVAIIYLDCVQQQSVFSREAMKLIEPLSRQIGIGLSNIWLRKSSEHAYRALRQSQENLIQREKLATIGEIAASVAHDLNTPLVTILGFAEEIDDTVADWSKKKQGDMPADTELVENIDNCSKKIMSAVKKMQKLVVSMRDFSRKSGNEFGPVNLGSVLEDVSSLTDKKLNALRIEKVVTIPADLPHIYGNGNQLEQVLMNLINNAADAMENSPQRRLGISAMLVPNGGVEITVSDTGLGIPPHIQKRIFDSFFTTKPAGKGTGLGLSIIKTVILGHEGSVAFESRENEGTSFSLRLPTIDENGDVKGRIEHDSTRGRIDLQDDDEALEHQGDSSENAEEGEGETFERYSKAM